MSQQEFYNRLRSIPKSTLDEVVSELKEADFVEDTFDASFNRAYFLNTNGQEEYIRREREAMKN